MLEMKTAVTNKYLFESQRLRESDVAHLGMLGFPPPGLLEKSFHVGSGLATALFAVV